MKTIFLIAIFFTSCQFQDTLTSENILKKVKEGTNATYHKAYYTKSYLHFTLTSYHNANYKTEINYDGKNRVKSIEGYLIDSLYGHSFDFYEGGNLKRYCYYTGKNNACSYIRKYSPNGKLEEEQGNPFVDHFKSNDSTILFFSSVFFNHFDVEVSSKNKPTRKLALQKSSMQPMLLEGRIFNSDSVFFLKITAADTESKERKLYGDTISVN
jgi:hypothetical protein